MAPSNMELFVALVKDFQLFHKELHFRRYSIPRPLECSEIQY